MDPVLCVPNFGSLFGRRTRIFAVPVVGVFRALLFFGSILVGASSQALVFVRAPRGAALFLGTCKVSLISLCWVLIAHVLRPCRTHPTRSPTQNWARTPKLCPTTVPMEAKHVLAEAPWSCPESKGVELQARPLSQNRPVAHKHERACHHCLTRSEHWCERGGVGKCVTGAEKEEWREKRTERKESKEERWERRKNRTMGRKTDCQDEREKRDKRKTG